MANEIRIKDLDLTSQLNKDNLFIMQDGDNPTNAIKLESLLSWILSNGAISLDTFKNSSSIISKSDKMNNTISFQLSLQNWYPNQIYKQDDYVIYNKALYQCNKTSSSSEIFPTEDFNEIIKASSDGPIDIDIATLEKAGIVKPDGTSITIEEDGTIHAIGGGGGSGGKVNWYISQEQPTSSLLQNGDIWLRIPDAQIFQYVFNTASETYKWENTGLNIKGPKGVDGVTPTVTVTEIQDGARTGYRILINGTPCDLYNGVNGVDGVTPVLTSEPTENGVNIYQGEELLCTILNGINGQDGIAQTIRLSEDEQGNVVISIIDIDGQTIIDSKTIRGGGGGGGSPFIIAPINPSSEGEFENGTIWLNTDSARFFGYQDESWSIIGQLDTPFKIKENNLIIKDSNYSQEIVEKQQNQYNVILGSYCKIINSTSGAASGECRNNFLAGYGQTIEGSSSCQYNSFLNFSNKISNCGQSQYNFLCGYQNEISNGGNFNYCLLLGRNNKITNGGGDTDNILMGETNLISQMSNSSYNTLIGQGLQLRNGSYSYYNIMLGSTNYIQGPNNYSNFIAGNLITLGSTEGGCRGNFLVGRSYSVTDGSEDNVIGGYGHGISSCQIDSCAIFGDNQKISNIKSLYGCTMGGRDNSIIGDEGKNGSDCVTLFGYSNEIINNGHGGCWCSVVLGYDNKLTDAQYGCLAAGYNNEIINLPYGAAVIGQFNKIKGTDWKAGQSHFIAGSYNEINQIEDKEEKRLTSVAFGQYNKGETEDTYYLLSLGNGSQTSSRKNAFAVDESGNGYFEGDVYLTNTVKVGDSIIETVTEVPAEPIENKVYHYVTETANKLITYSNEKWLSMSFAEDPDLN